MIQPIKFPNQYDVALEEAVQFQRNSNLDKLKIVASMIQFGWELVEIGPYHARVIELIDDSEKRWQETQQQLIAKYQASHGILIS